MPETQESPDQATLDELDRELDRLMELLNDPGALRRRADLLERQTVPKT